MRAVGCRARGASAAVSPAALRLPAHRAQRLGAQGLHNQRQTNGCRAEGSPHAPTTHVRGQGREFNAWLVDSGAQLGDSILLSRQGGSVLVKRVPAEGGSRSGGAAHSRAAATPVAQRALPSSSARRGGGGGGRGNGNSSRGGSGAGGGTRGGNGGGSGSGACELPFVPRVTKSIRAALAAPLPEGRRVQRVQQPDSSHTSWRVTVRAQLGRAGSAPLQHAWPETTHPFVSWAGGNGKAVPGC